MWIIIAIIIAYLFMGIISINKAIKMDGAKGDALTIIVMILLWPLYFRHLF